MQTLHTYRPITRGTDPTLKLALHMYTPYTGKYPADTESLRWYRLHIYRPYTGRAPTYTESLRCYRLLIYRPYAGTDPTYTESLHWYRLYLFTNRTQVQTLQIVSPYADTDYIFTDRTQVQTLHTHSPNTDTDFTYVQTENIINHLHIRKSRYPPPLHPRERHTLLIVQESWEGPETVWTSTENLDAKFLTLRRLMSYIYGAPILDVSRSHTTTQHSR